MDDRSEGTCNCAERTGELIVFTCPVCIKPVLEAMKVLTKTGLLVRVDRPGSVSGLALALEDHA